MTTNKTTTVEIRDNAYGTISVFWWDWPDEALLADFIEQDDRAEMDNGAEQADQPVENDFEYATLYFES